MTIAIVTAGDYVFAASTCVKLHQKGIVVKIIDVDGNVKNKIRKHLKLSILFGPFNILRCMYLSYVNKSYLKKNNLLIKLKKDNVVAFLDESYFSKIFLINYAWKLYPLPNFAIYNCHPSLLPSYRGITPIPHALLNEWNSAPSENIGLTIHKIDESYDQGATVFQSTINTNQIHTVFDAYVKVYDKISTSIIEISNFKIIEEAPINGGTYFSEISWLKVFKLKVLELRKSNFIAFVINGGLVGLFSWVIQLISLNWLSSFDLTLEIKIFISVWFAFFLAIIVNFLSQRWLIFSRYGNFFKFLIVTTIIISLVSFISLLIFKILQTIGLLHASSISYPIAALLIAPLSFYIKSNIVFLKK